MTLANSRVVRIAAASLITGVLIGAVGGIFRQVLVIADRLRGELIQWAHAWPNSGWLAPVMLALLGAAIARILVVRFAPEAEGSGLQRVEAVFAGQVQPAKLAVLPVKFVGGILAIGSGLALGREGPTVQMGASLGELVSGFLLKVKEDVRIVTAAGAGAGLAVAFNAPLGGSIFVFEELTSSFTPWLQLGTLTAAALAISVMRLFLGNEFDFAVPQASAPAIPLGWPFLILGAVLGALGALYNLVIVALLRLADRLPRWSSTSRAAFIGAMIGLTAWFAPGLVGGGETLTQSILSGHYAAKGLLVVVLVRFLIGPWSYAAGTPGGIFAPLLAVGTAVGALFGGLFGISPLTCAIIGMGAFFAATVRAPLTGIALTVEMTGRGDLTLGLLEASLMAMLIAMLLGSEPIYATLKRRMLEREAPAAEAAPAG